MGGTGFICHILWLRGIQETGLNCLNSDSRMVRCLRCPCLHDCFPGVWGYCSFGSRGLWMFYLWKAWAVTVRRSSEYSMTPRAHAALNQSTSWWTSPEDAGIQECWPFLGHAVGLLIHRILISRDFRYTTVLSFAFVFCFFPFLERIVDCFFLTWQNKENPTHVCKLWGSTNWMLMRAPPGVEAGSSGGRRTDCQQLYMLRLYSFQHF